MTPFTSPTNGMRAEYICVGMGVIISVAGTLMTLSSEKRQKNVVGDGHERTAQKQTPNSGDTEAGTTFA